ncbi:MAG: APC family permease [Conexivisphaera sp.]
MTPIDVVIWAIAAPAITGFLYFAPQELYLYGTSAIAAAYVLGFLVFVVPLLAIGFMVSAMPRAGGAFPILGRIFPPSLSYFFAWSLLVGRGIVTGILSAIAMLLLGSYVDYYGMVVHNSTVIAIGSAISSFRGMMIGALLLVLVLWIIGIFGSRAMKWFERIIFTLGMAFIILLIAALFVVAPHYTSTFDATWGAGVAETIISKAAALGYKMPAFSWSLVTGVLFVTIFSYAGSDTITFVSGEVRNPRRFAISFITGLLLVLALYVVTTYATGMISEIVAAYDFLYYQHPDVLKTIVPAAPAPSLPLFALSALPVWVSALMVGMILIWILKALVPIFLGVARVPFSMAYDRTFPMVFAKTNKYGSPIWSNTLIAVISLLGLYLYTYKVSVFLSLVTFFTLSYFWLMGLAAMIFPFVRKDIFEKTPIQWKVAGFPVISIVGLLALGTGFFIFTYLISELTVAAKVIYIVVMAIGLIIHMYQLHRNEKEGISLSDIYANIPPE